jgi:ureidoacrylate peracid hydrolase
VTTGNEKPPILDRTKTAMIVVDMQNGFLDDEGSITKAGMDITELKRAVGPVQRLVDACHATNLPIIFTRYVLRADHKDAGLLLERYPDFKKVNSLVAGTWDAELDPRMDVQAGDYILDKTRYSSFYNTNLEVILRGLAVDTLIICGVTTEICVESTVRDAYFRDYKILVPEDAVAATDVARHQGTLRTIQYAFGTVNTTAEVVDSLGVSFAAQRH